MNIMFVLLFVGVMVDMVCVASLSSYSFDSYLTGIPNCSYPNVQVKRNTISFNPIVVKKFHENEDLTDYWQLFYNITWESPDSRVDFHYKVQLQQRTSMKPLTVWSLYLCEENPSKSHDVNHPFYLVEALFTHEALFQVVPGLGGMPASDRVTFVKFNTPDCYESTKDRDFCATQSVVYSGAPADLRLIDVTKYLIDDALVPSFEWLDPVQVNTLANVVLYVVSIKNENDVTILFDMIYHQDDVERYTWEAVGNNNDDRELQENICYKITITPYVSSPDLNMEIVPGFDSEILFWTNVTRVVEDRSADAS